MNPFRALALIIALSIPSIVTAAADRSREILSVLPPAPVETSRDIPRSRLKATASSERQAYSAAATAIDGKLNRGWLSEMGVIKTKGPQSLTLELDAPRTISGLRYFRAAQTGRPMYVSWIGRIERYEIAVSGDGKEFRTVAAGQWNKEDLGEQRVEFTPVEARFVRLTALSAGHDTAGADEVVLESPQPPAPVGVKLPPPADTNARRENFAQRNAPAQLKFLSERLAKVAQRKNPALEDFFRLSEKGEHEAALRRFNAAVAARLKAFQPLVLAEAGADSPAPLGMAAEMMLNILSGEQLNSRFDVGEPGAIAWDAAKIKDELKTKGLRALSPVLFAPLLSEYARGGDERYLAKWAAFCDDMMLNDRGYRDLTPFTMADHDARGPARVLDLLAQLLRAELARSGTIDKLPAATLARVLLEMYPDQLALGAAYYHANAQNWTHHAATAFLITGAVIDGLIAQDVPLMERGWRLMDTYETLSNLPDGAEAEQALWYNWGYAGSALEFLHAADQIEKIEPGFAPLSAVERTELEEAMLRRVRFSVRMYTQQAQWPLFVRGDNRTAWMLSSLTRTPKEGDQWALPMGRYAARILNDPAIAPLLAMIGPEKKPGAQLGFNSNYFPWGGYRVLRENWDPQGAYGAMFASPSPGKYSARGGSDHLNFGLHAFGQDLLIDDAKGHYGGFLSPLMVDGKNQVYRVGYPTWGHKQILLNGWEKPDNARWFSGDSIQFAEGEYAGPYGGESAGNPAEIAKHNAEAIRGVRHGRQVIHLRNEGLWIVADRLRSEQPHRYTWRWMLPCAPEKSKFFAFTREQINVDPADKVISTRKSDGPNLTMRTFCDAPLQFTRRERNKAMYEYYGPRDNPWNSVCEINAETRAQRDVLAVTTLLPRRSMGEDFQSIARIDHPKAEGFTATLMSGARVHCLAARDSVAALSVGGIQMEGEMLLVLERAGKIGGLALGCKSFKIRGGAARPAYSDFAFNLDGERLAEVNPVYRPIELVRIEPGRNVFMQREQVSLSCPTPGVQIRYTLDGTDPTQDSALYEKPFEIVATATVKARAFRPDVQLAADDLDFTRGSPVSMAYFEKRDAAEAARTTDLKPGLRAAFHDGQWQKLLMNSTALPPTAEGMAANVFDLSLRKNTGPFMMVYEGYLNIPADGVYSFHAPAEMMDNKIDNGYELLLELDGRAWRPATRRHAFGTWSAALKKGPHAFRLKYLDYRGNEVKLLLNPAAPPEIIRIDHTAKSDRPNFPGMNGNYVWGGGVPRLLVSGSGLEKQPIPRAWLFHTPR